MSVSSPLVRCTYRSAPVLSARLALVHSRQCCSPRGMATGEMSLSMAGSFGGEVRIYHHPLDIGFQVAPVCPLALLIEGALGEDASDPGDVISCIKPDAHVEG